MASTRKIDKMDAAIHLIRGQRDMLDSDLAAVYQVTTKQLNQQLKRNAGRFPKDFAFQLTAKELTNLRSQIVTSSLHGAAMWEGPQCRDLKNLNSIGALRPLPLS